MLRPINSKFKTQFDLLAQDKICGKLPKIPSGPWVKELASEGIELSDLGTGCHDVDILLGNDHWSRILTGKMLKLSCGLMAIETVLGWTLGGRVPKPANNHAMLVTTMLSTSSDISFLWNLETIGVKDQIEPLTNEELDQVATLKFAETVERTSEGRFIVCLPWKDKSMKPPTNRLIAEKRLQHVTSKLQQQNKFQVYHDVFKLWEAKGFVKKITDDSAIGSYLPHRPVFKENSSTTPVRPVFDASCHGKGALSLNDCLHKGPNYLDHIPSHMLRFRENEFGITSDICKAFLTLVVNEKDQIYQKFFWWEDKTCSKMVTYIHERVMFGQNCSPFLLNAAIRYLLKSCEFLTTAEILLRAFYVDNCVTSLPTVQQYTTFRHESTHIMKTAGMNLRQWAHTIDEVKGLQVKSDDDVSDMFEKELAVSVLGYTWNRVQDTISCKVEEVTHQQKISKRLLLSIVAKVFDPIGFTCPVMLLPKLLLQQSWLQKVGWDDDLPEETKNKFKPWVLSLKLLEKIELPRFFQVNSSASKSVHVFCDASKYAYAAVGYIRSEYNQTVDVQLVLAKSRLAPIRKSTIPRLELMGCYMGVLLAEVIKTSLQYGSVRFYFWSDSTTALAWIKQRGDYGVFVSNRVNRILLSTTFDQWNHVPGACNPADLPSRGCSPQQLLESTWWEGPEWLRADETQWPKCSPVSDENEVHSELKKSAMFVSLNVNSTPKFSSYRKNVAVMGWVCRFVNQCRHKSIENTKFLKITELREAELFIIRDIQKEAFPTPIGKIGNISIMRDERGILRVQTRLTNRDDKREFICPILLPKNHPLVEQMIMDMHHFYCHGGLQFLVSKTRSKYWIIHTRRTIRRILNKCVTCRRHAAKHLEVEPVALPEKRVNDASPFQTTGVDLAGPVTLKNGSKAWIVLFTCALYRGVYLDVVTSLSSEAFINSLERFISQHGRPNTLYSDNGTNFVGASSIFKQLDWTKIEEESHIKQIQWRFNPATASWYGGWWERLVRSVKDLLKRMLGRTRITYDELRTCLSGVANTINDRPITILTEDNGDLIPLTPNMFLRPILQGTFPETDEAFTLSESYRKMKLVQRQIQDRFRKEYLAHLVMFANETRCKGVNVGDVVLIGYDNKKRYEWPMGKVIQLLPGKDGKVRVVRLKTAHGEMERPLQRIYPLEVSTNIPEKQVNLLEMFKTIRKERKKIQTEKVKPFSPHRPVVTKKGRVVKQPSRYGRWAN